MVLIFLCLSVAKANEYWHANFPPNTKIDERFNEIFKVNKPLTTITFLFTDIGEKENWKGGIYINNSGAVGIAYFHETWGNGIELKGGKIVMLRKVVISNDGSINEIKLLKHGENWSLSFSTLNPNKPNAKKFEYNVDLDCAKEYKDYAGAHHAADFFLIRAPDASGICSVS